MQDHQPAGPQTPDAARARLVDILGASGRALSRPIQAAFAQVPRHLFVPEVAASAAYRDEAFVIKCGPDGMPVSSSSQPAMMAIMLQQLGLEPSHRVLEIGTGSGYNAAVMSAVVGKRGRVVSIDIDPEMVARARSSLAAAGYDAVTVRCADGGYGDPAGAPFDRIIVTAGAWDIAPAWFQQLAPGGRLVLPLSVRGIQLSVALEQDGESWVGKSACRCGFVRMLGAFAGPERVVRIGAENPLYMQPADGGPVDADAFAAALFGPAVDVPAGLDLSDPMMLADLDLWLTLTQPGLGRVTLLAAPGEWLPLADGPELAIEDDPAEPLRLAAMLPSGGLVADPTDPDRLGIALLLPGELAHDRLEGAPGVVVRGHGPGGPTLAVRLARLAAGWHELGRPGTANLRLRVWPSGTQARHAPRGAVFDRPNVLVEAGWPEPDLPARS
jgi:protein-L-isoaspartate(D-aspartate) O-methyltransferase